MKEKFAALCMAMTIGLSCVSCSSEGTSNSATETNTDQLSGATTSSNDLGTSGLTIPPGTNFSDKQKAILFFTIGNHCTSILRLKNPETSKKCQSLSLQMGKSNTYEQILESAINLINSTCQNVEVENARDSKSATINTISGDTPNQSDLLNKMFCNNIELITAN